MRYLLLLYPLLVGCSLIDPNALGIKYTFEKLQYVEDLGAPSGQQVPDVACTDPATCAAIATTVGTWSSCDSTVQRCQANVNFRLVQEINLSNEQAFPKEVANSSLVQLVKVSAVHYWVMINTLSFDLPAIEVYVGPQSLKRESDTGAILLGTLPAQPRMQLTTCGQGAAGTESSRCHMQLTEEGKSALALLAKEYKTVFNLLLVGKTTIRSGDPLPSGKLDLYIQPEIEFQIPKL